MLKYIFSIIFYFASVLILVPLTITYMLNKNIMGTFEQLDSDIIQDVSFNDLENNSEEFSTLFISVENDNFENYIIGVVSAEMPSSFEIEALKAQAVASRTYAYRRVDNVNDEINYTNIGQAYDTIENMRSKWGDKFDDNYSKIKNAIVSTKGIIMTYEDEPIEAVFHSTSGGMTENAENIWGKNLPYIKSVDSYLDEEAPNFTYVSIISNNEIVSKIASKFSSSGINVSYDDIINSFEIKTRSEAGYVLEVYVCGYLMSGQDMRTLFDLRSSNFTIVKNSDSFEFTTKGYGHGVGMSQYGANFMAMEGYSYLEILEHYYSDIDFMKIF